MEPRGKAVKKAIFFLTVGLCANSFAAGIAEPLPIAGLDGKGQISNPRISPDGKSLYFEFLAANGDSAVVYTAEFSNPSASPLAVKSFEEVISSKKQDVFSLGGPGDQIVTEHPSWGPSTQRGQTIAVAATRKEASRGASQINFDIFFKAPGKKRFLTEHPANDSEPVFSPGGDYLVYASGRSGEGDLYAYSFFDEVSPTKRITFDESGSELYQRWSPDGKKLAYIAHMGSSDHLLINDDVVRLIKEPDEAQRKVISRSITRDVTQGWQHSCLGPAFSPDGKRVAFFVHPKSEQTRTDLYVVKADGAGEPVLLMENVIPPSRGGPCWSADGSGIYAVEENAAEMNPVVFVPIDPYKKRERINTGTQLNTELSLWTGPGGASYVVFAAQGGGEKDGEKRWRRLFVFKPKK
ncbi:hypothetical protein FDZ71_02345 [bacterium]|nr:MAG: hypothetical protein FDZ71_02345 [bacterium]